MVIAHATDLTGDDTAAFVHAAALAAASSSRLVTVHGNPGARTAASLPDARALAATWGASVEHDRRCHECCDDVADSVIDVVRELRPELVVLGTHGRRGLANLFRGSVSESVTRNIDVPTLIVPNRGRGFVDPTSGVIDLHLILIPAGSLPEAMRGVQAARALLRMARVEGASLELLHAGPAVPELDRLGLPVTRVDGALEHAILDAASTRKACAIVMPTRGHDGIGDALAGSHAEHVMRETTCPLLVVPL